VKLIKVELNQNNEQVVSTRELHKGLGIEKHFSQWWEQQAGRLKLIEGRDFLTLKLESTGGRPGTDCIVKLDIAKHICMVSGGEKAWQIRDYFIADIQS